MTGTDNPAANIRLAASLRASIAVAGNMGDQALFFSFLRMLDGPASASECGSLLRCRGSLCWCGFRPMLSCEAA